MSDSETINTQKVDSSDRTTWCYPMTISWDMEQHTQYLHQQHMHLHRQHMRKLRDEERT